KGRDTVAFRSFMYYSRHAGRRAFRWAKFWWWPFVLLASAWVPSGVWASCLENPDPEIRRLQEMVDEDATKALKQSKTLFATLKREKLMDSNASRVAALYG